MLLIYRLLWVGLLGFGIGAATAAQAGLQIFDASWTVKAFGNECSAADPSPGPHCPAFGEGTGDSRFYQAYGMPQAIKCNPTQPRCPFDSTPTNGIDGKFHPLGGSKSQALHCAPWYNFQGLTTGNGAKTGTMRPAKGATATTGGSNQRPVPPLYRNPQFFTPGGQPDDYSCLGTSTDGFGGPGLAMLGNPVTGRWSAVTTGNQRGGFNFVAASTAVPPVLSKGVRTTGVVGEFGPVFPYLYSYTYATLRNDAGMFAPGSGLGNFSANYGNGAGGIKVTQGAAKFGGTMRMLGALTTKVCYYRNDGCSLGGADWRYEAAGASAYKSAGGEVTAGYVATDKAYYYHTGLMQKSTVQVSGYRFPWTTGTVTVTAVGDGPHKTIHYARGFDNRNTATPNGMGTIQLVTPVLTRWSQPTLLIHTGGVGILRIKFLPEPQTWVMLVAGVSLLGVVYRMRAR